MSSRATPVEPDPIDPQSPATVAGVDESRPPEGPPVDGRAPRSRRRRGTVLLVVALCVIVIASGAGFAWMSAQLTQSRARITDQEQRIQDQQRELDEQREVIERKEQFGAAMADLYVTVDPLVGLPYSTLVPWTQIEAIAGRAWQHRWTPAALDRDILDLKTLTSDLVVRADAAREEAASNVSGSVWEATLDELGSGWVSMGFDESDRPCGLEAMACVSGASPFFVEVGAGTRTDEQLTDWMRTGVAYHEFAHVLQFTNPEATASALTAFADDPETMADCYALTVLDGWTLEHEVPIDATSSWEVHLGYGYTCDDDQRQVIRDWLGALGVQKRIVGS